MLLFMKTKDMFKRRKVLYSPFLLFSPFLLLSIVLILLYSTPSVMDGDENKYLGFANNLIHGFYSLPAPNIYLAVGPGYPLLIAPLIALKIPIICITLINAFLYYLSIIFLFKTLLQIVDKRVAVTVSLFWALYYNLYESFQFIGPEILAPFLFSLLLYFLVKSFVSKHILSDKYIYLAGLTLGYIALSKIIFGYVILCMIIGNGLLWIFNRNSINYSKGLMILIVALITTSPYLLYTYSLTGRIFYWGTTAGNNMYWMSTPFEKEFGSWSPEPIHVEDSMVSMKSNSEFRRNEYNKMITNGGQIPGYDEYIWYNHHKNFVEIKKIKGVEQDDVLKRIAINNIRAHPVKYIQNCFSNVGRIFFNFPYSYKLQNPGTLLRIPLNGIILTLLLFSLYPTLLNWKKLIYPIRFSIFIFVLYFGGSLTGSAEIRMFTVIVPILLIWISFVLQRSLKINWRFD